VNSLLLECIVFTKQLTILSFHGNVFVILHLCEEALFVKVSYNMENIAIGKVEY
jgi:hypothetical protein